LRLLALQRADPGRAIPSPGARRAAAALATAAVALLAACGQKGPLYLPEKGGTVVTSGSSAPAPAQNIPAQPSPTPQPQSGPQPPSAPAPHKNSTNDDDQQTPQ
jgi:predicted small lipoprotein YifL